MRNMLHAIAFCALCAMSVPPMQAQSTVHKLDFDLWCSEIMHYPDRRCTERRAGDLADYDAFSEKIEKFDVERERERNRQLRLQHTVLHNDSLNHAGQPTDPANDRQEP